MAHDGVSVTIKGLNELGARLQAFSNNIATTVTAEGLKDGCKIFQAETIHNIKTTCKNNKRHKLKVRGEYIWIEPGNLAKNIFVKRVKKMPKGVVRYEVFLKKDHAWYGVFVERGTSRMAANPNFARAFESKRVEAYSALKARIERALREGGK